MEHLHEAINRFLRTGQGKFEELALALFQYQFEKNRPYQVYCQAQGKTPEQISHWEDIPAVPIQAFKSKELATFPVAQAAALFHSSTTTSKTPSRHFIRDLRYYEASVKSGFERWVFSAPFLMLTPSPAEAPHSSLSWMMEVLRGQWGSPCSDYFVLRGRLDEPRLARVLTRIQQSKEKVMLLGTTLAFLAFFDYCTQTGQRFQLPSGSRLMDTGGMKTRRYEISRPVFVDQVQSVLGISESDCINEYSMCELSSQFYGQGRSLFLQGPPWTRTRLIDPVTGEPATPGEQGLLCHYDLANVDSVMAVQTEDRGVAQGTGFLFQGRASEAELKGCSLNAEAFLR